MGSLHHTNRSRRIGGLMGLLIGGACTAPVLLGGCDLITSSNVVWFEATAATNATVLSQGPGRALTLACATRGNGQPCRWTVRMLLRSTEALRSWSMSLLGESGSALLQVNNFNYVLTGFTMPAGGETFGPEPDLLEGTGASTAVTIGVAPGDYTLLQFELEFDNPVGGPEVRTILAAFGDNGWTSTEIDDQVPPLVQAGNNLPAPGIGGAILPNPVIIVDHAESDSPTRELCGDGVDNDGDDDVDCDDRQCEHHPLCGRERPTIQCPRDLTVECDGAGNTTAVNRWLNSATAQSTCGDLRVTNDFDGLDNDRCGDAGSSRVTWRATDDCGAASCSATLHIEDTTPPTVSGPADLTFVCDESGTQTQLDDWLGSATTSDVCGDSTVGFSPGRTSLNCSGKIVWTATDQCDHLATDSALLTIQGDTEPPIMTLNGRASMTLECGVDAYNEPGANVADDCDATLTDPTIGGQAVDTHEPGIYVVTYDAVDLCNHSAPRLSRTVTVVDTRPPRIELRAVELRPPNHEYVTLHLSDCARLIDDCEGELRINLVGNILSVASDEPDNANGDGNTTNDIEIVDHSTFRARAERQGGGDGRTYSIRFEADDGLGHRLESTCFVEVSHDRSDEDDDDHEDDDDDDDEGDDHDEDEDDDRDEEDDD